MLSDGGLPAFSKATFLAASGDKGKATLEQIGARTSRGEDLSDEEIRDVGRKFEGLLLHQLLSAMRKTVPENEVFGESSATKIYRDMFDEHIAEKVADSGQSGLGDEIVAEILRQQQSRKVTLPEGDSPMRPLKPEDNPMRPLEEKVPFAPIPRTVEELKPIDRHEAELRPLR